VSDINSDFGRFFPEATKALMAVKLEDALLKPAPADERLRAILKVFRELFALECLLREND
jgi:hypothetical protein